MSMLYAIVAARFKAFPEVKRKGTRNLPEMVLFTSEDVSEQFVSTLETYIRILISS